MTVFRTGNADAAHRDPDVRALSRWVGERSLLTGRSMCSGNRRAFLAAGTGPS